MFQQSDTNTLYPWLCITEGQTCLQSILSNMQLFLLAVQMNSDFNGNKKSCCGAAEASRAAVWADEDRLA